jgi:multicomponent Na+:H+ antiporter subunit E
VYPFLIFFLLLLNWVAFSGKFDAFHLGLGAFSALVVTLLSQDLLFSDRKKSLGNRFREAGRFLRYALWLLWQIALANVHVFKLAITRSGQDEIAPKVVTFKTKLKSDFAKFVFANSITLTPGTITIALRGNEFLVHAISEATAKDLATGEMERRVAEVFEPEVAV